MATVTHIITSRRGLLAGLAAGTASVTIATGAALALDAAEGGTVMPPPSDADAELIALGREFDAALAVYKAFRPEYDAAAKAQDKAIKASWPEWERVRDLHGYKAAEQVTLAAIRPTDAPISHGNDLAEAVNQPAEKISKLVPRTLAGLAVQARAVAWALEHTEGKPRADLDWDALVTLRLIDSINALAAATEGRIL